MARFRQVHDAGEVQGLPGLRAKAVAAAAGAAVVAALAAAASPAARHRVPEVAVVSAPQPGAATPGGPPRPAPEPPTRAAPAG